MSNPYRPGNPVRHRPSDMRMTVVRTDGDLCLCEWEEEERGTSGAGVWFRRRTRSFPWKTLVPVEDYSVGGFSE